ncbi:glycosyltransferase [Flavobacterium ardleyense]|uniref:Glycosyltransferase n=1 Tax=Flavobacterium ardleyense TaxID=2038737 RepID=A0ABW5Z6E6_9FLAO
MPNFQPSSLKICLIGTSLANGGSNKNHALLSKLFFENHHIVWNVIVVDKVTFDYSGELLNLGKIKSKGIFNRIKRLFVLKRFLKQQRFDFIIDFRNKSSFVQEWLTMQLLFNSENYIPTIRSFHTEFYFPGSDYLASNLYKSVYGIVTVSKAIEEKVKLRYKYDNVTTLYNPLALQSLKSLANEPISISGKYIVSAGRMNDKENIKQFDLLIEAYSKSILPQNNIQLVLLGDGYEEQKLPELAKKMNVYENVVFLGFQKNPYKFYKNALFYVLTSKNEGFPTVINEAMACGTPVISFDCESGPNEMIIHNETGILVKNQDFDDLTFQMNHITLDQNKYSKIKNASNSRAKLHSFDKIYVDWLTFFKQ